LGIALGNDITCLKNTLGDLKTEIQRILGLLKQCKRERDRDPTGDQIYDFSITLGIAYGAWWAAKNSRIRSWHVDVMCGVDQLDPKIISVRVCLDALNADVNLQVLQKVTAAAAAPVQNLAPAPAPAPVVNAAAAPLPLNVAPAPIQRTQRWKDTH